LRIIELLERNIAFFASIYPDGIEDNVACYSNSLEKLQTDFTRIQWHLADLKRALFNLKLALSGPIGLDDILAEVIQLYENLPDDFDLSKSVRGDLSHVYVMHNAICHVEPTEEHIGLWGLKNTIPSESLSGQNSSSLAYELGYALNIARAAESEHPDMMKYALVTLKTLVGIAAPDFSGSLEPIIRELFGDEPKPDWISVYIANSNFKELGERLLQSILEVDSEEE
jgi:hypothetical protein